jgi:hypothetical protein
MNVREEMVMIFDNKNVILLVSSRKLLQRKKERLNILCLNEKSFIVFMFFFCVLYKRGRLV